MAASPSALSDLGPAPSKRRFRRVVTVLWVVAALVLTVNLVGGRGESPDSAGPPHAPPAVAAASGGPDLPDTSSPSAAPHRPGASGPHLQRSRPVRLLIPKISVDAPFTALAINDFGQLEPPPAEDTNLVGWYAKGHTPGEAGTAIIAGHVDTATAPAVFAGLNALKKGDRFQVARADGSKATFAVDAVESFEKDAFPSDRVYGDTPRAQVRLITCSGSYDRQARDYTENLVVFAHLV
ncbi:class F sortase [Streptomyces sp. NEAU-H22]|uniref:class F sortase n=1 Tax=unclassified Streptomyces TaxID=2593676 RepID=UPI002256FA30|nr:MULTISPECIES: class F sortase [unclassified Streptomyces]MCX3290273.1 class F sortase [Streptomyces sp. NEAU-H22]WMD07025.1 class F sortase [Streptomyces sp. FXY-T5]